ncbi:hypothetical protein I553_7078 [Mycobacterium xenopi 4042]|uniref:Uncharacterized protein n=1 Tax=Mycobacterium xenopi 4042 TaxID=1299334 RepID=X7Z596_MYCXE|nr:hypothetical protein I553_7078 [Mycobacterium xenopi 4042]EUA33913.1 hypothetical protein I552_4694 [Mycobacterium xenopi 3993]
MAAAKAGIGDVFDVSRDERMAADRRRYLEVFARTADRDGG